MSTRVRPTVERCRQPTAGQTDREAAPHRRAAANGRRRHRRTGEARERDERALVCATAARLNLT